VLSNESGNNFTIGCQGSDSGFLVIAHKATVAFDVCAEDSGEFTLKTFVCHAVPPSLRFQTKELRIKMKQKNTVSGEQQDSIQQIENRWIL
jgi:hypothetical protein